MGLGLGTRLTQGLRQRQEMVLAPRMLQSIEVLSLPLGDLEQWLDAQAEGNEALVVERPQEGGDAGGDESLWLGPARSRAAQSQASDDHRALIEAQPAPERSLADIVEDEIASRDLEPDLADWVRFLGGCLDGAGLLTLDDDQLAEIAEEIGLPAAGTGRGQALLADAIGLLQQFEPRGIGARSSVEALLIQLDPNDEDYGLLCILLEDFLVELSRNQRNKVASKLGLELRELERLLGVLERLEMRPAREYSGAAAPVIQPDLVATLENDDTVTVELTRGALPSVSIDADLEALYATIDRGSEARAYLAKKLERARWVTEAVELRGATLLRVADVALGRQAEFLRRGPSALVPLGMAEVSEVLGLATSTVSRAVAGKYVQTPWGIVALRSLFQSTAGTSATDAVRDAVGKLVAEEDPARPLSDEALVEALARLGHVVARRTVAKYRKELDIPSSYLRRRDG